MLVYDLRVEEAALAVASSKSGCGTSSILGVSAIAAFTVVPLGRLRRAAGAHLGRCRERLPLGAAPLPRRAALTKLPRRATLQRARTATGLPRTCANVALGEKAERHGKLAPVTDI